MILSEIICKCGVEFTCEGLKDLGEDVGDTVEDVEFCVLCPICGVYVHSEGFVENSAS